VTIFKIDSFECAKLLLNLTPRNKKERRWQKAIGVKNWRNQIALI